MPGHKIYHEVTNSLVSWRPKTDISQKNFFSHLFLLEDSVDWEKELQQELQEYEVVAESEKRDENWDKEIEEMLKEEN